MVGQHCHNLIESSMGRIQDWEKYLDEEIEEKPQKIRKFKDSEDKPHKKRKS